MIPLIETGPTYTAKSGDRLDDRYVILFPSDPEGVFIVADDYYGIRAVGQVTLLGAGIEQSDLDSLENGGDFPLGNYVEVSNDDPAKAEVTGFAAEVFIAGSGSQEGAYIPVDEFREMASVPVTFSAPLKAADIAAMLA